MTSGRVLDEQGGSRNKKVFALGEYQGHRYLEIAEYYLDRTSNEWRKKKGVTINRDAYRILRSVIEGHNEEIMDWIGVGYIPEEVSRYEEAQEAALTDNRFRIGKTALDAYNEPRDPRFFQVHHEGGLDRALLNRAHPLASVLAKEEERVQLLVGAMLASYQRARSILAGSPAFDPETLFIHLEQDWGKYLRDALRK